MSEPLSRVPTPPRLRRQRPVASGLNWCRPEDVPGAILPPHVAQELADRLRALNEHTARARLSGASYVLTR